MKQRIIGIDLIVTGPACSLSNIMIVGSMTPESAAEWLQGEVEELVETRLRSTEYRN